MNKNTAAPLPKKAIIGIALFVCAILAILLTVLFMRHNTGYRDILVFDADTDATVYRDGSNIAIYEGMKLQSGDNLKVTGDNFLRLKLDEDKYVTLEPGTEILLVATGNSENSNTSIQLISGSILNEIDSKLSASSTYEITTPASVMAVRGTAFYVALKKDNSDQYTVDLAVLDGTVGTMASGSDGTEIFVNAGEASQLYGSENGAEVLFTGEPIDYSIFSPDIIERIIERKEDGYWEDLPATVEELQAAMDEPDDGNPPSLSDEENNVSESEETDSETEQDSEKTGDADTQNTEIKTAGTPSPKKKSPASSNQATASSETTAATENAQTPAPPSDAGTPYIAPPEQNSETKEFSENSTQTPGKDHQIQTVYTVTFISADGTIFAKQTVKDGTRAVSPSLVPVGGNNWYLGDTVYDFNTPVTADITLCYK